MPFLTRLHGIAGPDRAQWVVSLPMLYRDPRTGTVYAVPASAHSDLASIPQLVRWLIPGNGHERQPAVVHDRGYDTLGRIEIILNPGMLPTVPDDYNPWDDAAPPPFQHRLTPVEARIVELWDSCALEIGHADLDRSELDSLFAQANRCANVHPLGRPVLYGAVVVGGWVPWARYEREWERDPDAWQASRDLTSGRCRIEPPAELDAIDV